MKNKKIAVITQAVKLADEVAGLNRTSYIAELLANEGYEVDLLTSTFQHWEKERRPIADKKYYELPYNVVFLEEPGYKKNIGISRIRSQEIFAANLLKYLHRFGNEYDLIWCQIPPNNIAATAGRFAQERNIPFIVDVNDLWPEAMKMVANVPGVTDFALRSFTEDAETAYACAAAVTGTSHEYTSRCTQDIPHVTVYVGGDISVFDEGVSNHIDRVFKAVDELWVTYAGSLAKSYDIETLIAACDMVTPLIEETMSKRLSLRILGDGPYRQKFEEAADGSTADVHFMGYLPYQEMAAHLAKSDILVNSLIKGSPQSIVSKIADYLAAGKPIINTGESPEFMEMCARDGFGVNIEPENVLDLAGAIMLLAENDELRMLMGTQGRMIAEEQFDRPRAYRRIVELVDELLEQ